MALDQQFAKFVVAIDPDELAVRMCEAGYGLARPDGMSAKEALDAMEIDCREGWKRAALAAMAYWRDCIENRGIARDIAREINDRSLS
jgi:hypothetical protein